MEREPGVAFHSSKRAPSPGAKLGSVLRECFVSPVCVPAPTGHHVWDKLPSFLPRPVAHGFLFYKSQESGPELGFDRSVSCGGGCSVALSTGASWGACVWLWESRWGHCTDFRGLGKELCRQAWEDGAEARGLGLGEEGLLACWALTPSCRGAIPQAPPACTLSRQLMASKWDTWAVARDGMPSLPQTVLHGRKVLKL